MFLAVRAGPAFYRRPALLGLSTRALQTEMLSQVDLSNTVFINDLFGLP